MCKLWKDAAHYQRRLGFHIISTVVQKIRLLICCYDSGTYVPSHNSSGSVKSDLLWSKLRDSVSNMIHLQQQEVWCDLPLRNCEVRLLPPLPPPTPPTPPPEAVVNNDNDNDEDEDDEDDNNNNNNNEINDDHISLSSSQQLQNREFEALLLLDSESGSNYIKSIYDSDIEHINKLSIQLQLEFDKYSNRCGDMTNSHFTQLQKISELNAIIQNKSDEIKRFEENIAKGK